MRTLSTNEAGFTLIEVLVAALLVALVSGSLSVALIGAFDSAANERHKTQMGLLAEQDQQRMRGLSALQLNGLNQTRTVTLDGVLYHVTSTGAFLNTSGSSSCGTSGNGAAAYFQTTSSVNFVGNKLPPVVAESVVTPPAGGVLLAQAIDQTGAGLSGVGVVANGPSYAAGTTDSTGCTELAALGAGSYTVTFTDNGYVDPNGNPSPLSESASVTATGTSRPSPNPVMIGLAGTVNAQFSAPAHALTGANTVTANALSWFGNGSSTTMSGYQTNTPSSPPATLIPSSGTIALFPFMFTGPSYVGNYQVWAGPCQQMEPPSATDKFNVAPGSNQTLAVKEPTLDVVAQNTGTRIAPSHVKLSFASTSGPACSSSWYAPIATDAATNANGSLASPGQPFATTATSGGTASASGYTGTYSVCADAPISGTTREATVTGVTNTIFSGSLTPVTINITSGSTQGSC